MKRIATPMLVALFLVACGPGGLGQPPSGPGGGGGGGATGGGGGGGWSGGSDAGSTGGGGGGWSAAGGGSGGAGGGGGGAAGPGVTGGTGSDGGVVVQPGTLTAGVWDDNVNFDAFVAYRDGLAQQPGLPPFTPAEQQSARQAAQTRLGASTLDVALVIDTTGSMGDEITYLQTEFDALTTALAARFPTVPQRWAVVAYRDVGDDYVVRSVDFSSNLSQVRASLGQLQAGGGGDYPEAPEQALAAAATLNWTSQARLVFWVADAPPHAENAPALADAVRTLAARGVSVNPVASSGIDEVTEYTMRASAQRTGGRYLFLTNDSGVGGDHKEPSVSCYYVTKLIYALERVIDAELTGQAAALDPARVIREVGSPQNGTCTLSSGATTQAF